MKQSNAFPKIIGITGGIASGKTTIMDYVKLNGYQLIDADLISKEIYLKGKPCYFELVEVFTENILDASLEISRKKLADLVFKEKDKLDILNDITHKYIINEIENDISRFKEEYCQLIKTGQKIYDTDKLLFVDIPLLFESKHDYGFDSICTIYAPKDVQLKRLMSRDNLTEELALFRINSQMDIEKKKAMSPMVVDNTQEVFKAIMRIQQFIDNLLV